MGVSSKRKYEVCERNDKGIEFKVVFESLEEVHDALLELQNMKQAFELQGTIQTLRGRCDTSDGKVYIPNDLQKLPKARWVMLAAAASFPNGVPIKQPLKRLGIDNAALSAYCTSKNNPTSKYLYIRDEMIFTNPEGITWVDGLLKA
ncbi:MAG: hypothetical protein ACXACG_12180 [Candidatus Thorarchaeota archaeon]